MAPTRVLLVDDSAALRRALSSIVQSNEDLQIICEASDGSEAVQVAEKLQPDLILLDVGLPKLNGIEAARQIRKISPSSKILFLTQDPSDELAEEAFCLGARGYVVKGQAASELLPAIEVVMQGKQFVSGGMVGRGVFEVVDAEPLEGSGKDRTPK
jgi:DNA-binding NarL/FixJ family response regulator